MSTKQQIKNLSNIKLPLKGFAIGFTSKGKLKVEKVAIVAIKVDKNGVIFFKNEQDLTQELFSTRVEAEDKLKELLNARLVNINKAKVETLKHLEDINNYEKERKSIKDSVLKKPEQEVVTKKQKTSQVPQIKTKPFPNGSTTRRG